MRIKKPYNIVTEIKKFKNSKKHKKSKSKLTDKEFYKLLKEAQKDPQFIKDIKIFIKATTS